jgi:3-methyl-2-oxobutanoate hydroxymethyltransferase
MSNLNLKPKIVSDFEVMKKSSDLITMVTCYDFTFAKILNHSNVDILLVGDSGAMIQSGAPSTLEATADFMAALTLATRRGAPHKFIVSDMPFLSYRAGITRAMDCVAQLMRAGANAVKLEGVKGHEKIIEQIVDSGVPVMGHIGLTPQSINQMGGYKVQGKLKEDSERLLKEAKALENLGCFSVVLECIPKPLANQITSELKIPTVGIGAGVSCDGQVLVLHDLLGLNTEFKPKFLRHFMSGAKQVEQAIEQYVTNVKQRSFPNDQESYL